MGQNTLDGEGKSWSLVLGGLVRDSQRHPTWSGRMCPEEKGQGVCSKQRHVERHSSTKLLGVCHGNA